MRACLRSIALLSLAVAAALAAAAPATSSDGRVRAGVAAVDASWHVGASAGQYATDGSFVGRPRRRPDHALVPPQRLLRDPVAARGARARGRGRRRPARRARQERPLHPAGPALPPHGAAARAGRLGHHAREPHDGRHARPLLAVLLLHLVGRLGVPGRLRRALLRLLREAHGRGGRAGRRRPEAGPRRRLGEHVRQDAAPLVRARGRRRRHAGRLSARATPTTT